MKFTMITAVGAVTLLGACGGGSTGPIPLEDLIARANAFEASVAPLNIDELPLTPDGALQTMGTAGFTGIAVYARENETDQDVTDFAAIGSAELSVNFETGVVAGTADDFYQIDDNNIDNISDITGTSIAGSVSYDLTRGVDEDNFYAGRANGSLTATNGIAYAFDLPAGGGLVGDTGQGFAVEAFEANGLDGFGVLALRD